MSINSNISPLSLDNNQINNEVLINTDDKEISEALKFENSQITNDASPIFTDQSILLNNNVSNPMIQNTPIINNNLVSAEPLLELQNNDTSIEKLNIDDVINAPDIEDLNDE